MARGDAALVPAKVAFVSSVRLDMHLKSDKACPSLAWT